MAAAQQLTRAGHHVVVYERDDLPGGLVRYGIPDFKMDKSLLERRVEQMEAEGTAFECGVEVGVDLSVEDLRSAHDAIVLAIGALWQRDLEIPGRHLDGVHLAMEYLVASNRVQATLLSHPPIDAAGKRVIIIGGGDTGADCLGTAHRQGRRRSTSSISTSARPMSAPRRHPGRSGRWCCVSRWRTRRVASGSSRPIPTLSSATVRATCGPCRHIGRVHLQARVRAARGQRFRTRS